HSCRADFSVPLQIDPETNGLAAVIEGLQRAAGDGGNQHVDSVAAHVDDGVHRIRHQGSGAGAGDFPRRRAGPKNCTASLAAGGGLRGIPGEPARLNGAWQIGCRFPPLSNDYSMWRDSRQGSREEPAKRASSRRVSLDTQEGVSGWAAYGFWSARARARSC